MADSAIKAAADVATHVRLVRRRLEGAGVASAQLDARLLVCSAAGITHEQYIADPCRVLRADEADRLEQIVARRISREPVSRIVGSREFWGRRFEITPETLDPRSDTETLVEAVLEQMDIAGRTAPMIADLGTGSGCLLVTLLCELPGACGVGVDIAPHAVAATLRNARAHGVDGRALLVCGDWLSAVDAGFDLIVSNPPYIRSRDIDDLEPEVRRHEPRGALDGGADGLDCYRKISHEVRGLLKNDGKLVLELGKGQHDDVAEILKSGGYRIEGTCEDLSGIVRCLWATPNG